ncbi:putative cardiolipin synthase (CMP-forming) [Dirofilaria immitis]
MFRRIWPHCLIIRRKALSLVYPDVIFLPSIAFSSSSRFLKSNRGIRIYTSQHIAKVKGRLDKNEYGLGNKIATIPNVLCVCRIGLTPIIGYLVIEESYITALALFAVSGITDWLDGYIARNVRNQSSLVGSIIDPIADKLFITTLFVILTYVRLMPISLTVLVILRDIALTVGGALTRYKTMEKPVTLVRYFNPSVSPLQVIPTFISKMCAAAGSLANPLLDFMDHSFLTYIYFATAATTIYSGFQYARLTRMKPVKKN